MKIQFLIELTRYVKITYNYVKKFDVGITGITGSREELNKLYETFRVYSKRLDDSAMPNNYNINHTDQIFLMDSKGNFVTNFSASLDVPEMLRVINSEINSTPKG